MCLSDSQATEKKEEMMEMEKHCEHVTKWERSDVQSQDHARSSPVLPESGKFTAL